MRPWPGERDPVVAVSYELVVGFDDTGTPVYASGIERSPDTLLAIQRSLEPLELAPASITSETLSKVDVLLKSGARVSLRPVFHPSLGRYKGLLKVDEYDVLMPDALADVFNRWRDDLSRGHQ